MKNIETHIDGNILTVKVDLTKEFGLSNTGKSIVVGTTSGPIPINHQSGVKINLTAFKKPGVSIPRQFNLDETPKRKEVNNVKPRQISSNGIDKTTKEEISLRFRKRVRNNEITRTPGLDNWRY